jgi:hypothetical protein
MEFSVEFYTSEAGRAPVQNFLDELKQSDPDDFAAVVAGLAKLRNLYFFMRGRRIVAVHGIRNKGMAIPARDRHTAQERMKEWLARIES